MGSRAKHVLVTFVVAWASGCSEELGPPAQTATRVLLDAADPIARWLNRRMDAQQRVAVGSELFYLDLLHGVAEQLGCAPGSIRHFLISDSLLSSSPFPRLVSTACNDDSWLATQFFLSAPFEQVGTGDIDVHALEAFAWDPDAGRYRFYATRPFAASARRTGPPPEPLYRELVPSTVPLAEATAFAETPSFVHVEIDPEPCRNCHLARADRPDDARPAMPIMNELAAPWPHWNAGAGQRSHSFAIPERTAQAPAFRALTADPRRLGAAADMEALVRDGHRRVAWARRRDLWERPAEVEEALSLLRPLFCEEQVNYVAEDFDNPVIPLDLLVAGGTIEALLAVQPVGLPWSWLHRRELRLPARSREQAPLCMAPVRGNADISVEIDLVGRGLLAGEDVLAVRALDWQTPVFSQFRCELWRSAHTRLGARPPAFPSGARNRDVLAGLLDRVLESGAQPLRLRGQEPARFTVLDRASRAAVSELEAALAGGTLLARPCGPRDPAPCAATLAELGARIDAHIGAHSADPGVRTCLGAELSRRQQHAQAFPSRPSFSCYTGTSFEPPARDHAPGLAARCIAQPQE